METSFYAWRRELIIRVREYGEVDEQEAAKRVTPNQVKDGRGRTIRVCFRQSDQEGLRSVVEQKPEKSPFVAVDLVPDTQPPESGDQSRTSAAMSGLTITTPSGYQVAVTSAGDLNLLEQVINLLKEKKEC